VRTTQRFRAELPYPCVMGMDSTFIDIAYDVLKQWGLDKVPIIISEDGTASQVRVDVAENWEKRTCLVFGLCGGCYEVSTFQEFQRLVTCVEWGTTVYVFTLVPLIEGAPHFPLFAYCHNSSKSSFTASSVLKNWQYLWQVSTPHP
jgi:hypothetical protein